MNVIDTHAHLYMKEFQKDIDFVIQRSLKKGVKKIFLPSINNLNLSSLLKLKEKYPKICYPMIGLHPSYVYDHNYNLKELKKMKKIIEKKSFISVGEIGMDLHSKTKFLSEQKYVLQEQIKWAQEKKIPVVIHCRNAFNYVFDIIKKFYKNLNGIFHCFSGSFEQAQKIIDFGMKLGIGGIITFKNNHIIQFLKKIKLNNIVLETDSPYLSPHPLRGQRNEPSNLKIILEKLSHIYEIPEKIIEKSTNENVQNLFF